MTRYNYVENLGSELMVNINENVFPKIGVYTWKALSWITLHQIQFNNTNPTQIQNILLTIHSNSHIIFIQNFRIVNSKMLVPQQNTTNKCYINDLLVVFLRGGTLWYNIDGCSHQYRFCKV